MHLVGFQCSHKTVLVVAVVCSFEGYEDTGLEHRLIMSSFSVANILGKAPNEPKLEDVMKLDRQLGALILRV